MPLLQEAHRLNFRDGTSLFIRRERHLLCDATEGRVGVWVWDGQGSKFNTCIEKNIFIVSISNN